MDITTYLAVEFARYFPDTSIVVVIDEDHEIITARVAYPAGFPDTWICEIGSDDDRYTFTRCEDGNIADYRATITVPLMAEGNN